MKEAFSFYSKTTGKTKRTKEILPWENNVRSLNQTLRKGEETFKIFNKLPFRVLCLNYLSIPPLCG